MTKPIMRVNVGKLDRILRTVIGGAAVTLGIFMHSWSGLLGVYPFFTGVFGSCSIYRALGINTLSGSNEK